MELTAYRFFNKRKNSTKRPAGGSVRNVVLLDDVSLYSPVFECNYWDYNDNYVKWAGRYYYVVDVVCKRRDVFDVHCEIDTLATWKDDIKGTNAFVTFSTSDYDIGIPDYRLSSDPLTIVKTSQKAVFPSLSEAYVVTYIGKNSCPSVGIGDFWLDGLQKHIMSDKFVQSTRKWYKSFCEGEGTDKVDSNVIATLVGNNANCITSCIYMPKFYGTKGHTIVLAGGYNTYAQGLLAEHNYSETYKINIPWAFPIGDFRNRAQFTSMAVYLPGYGFIPLNADNYQGESSISVQATLDSFTGEITYLVDGKAKGTCSTGYPVQIGTSQKGNVVGALTGVAQAVASGYSGNAIGALSSGYNAIRSIMGVDPSSVGSMGGATAFNAHRNIVVLIMSHNTNVDPSSVGSTIGRPLNAVRNIGSLSGYVQTADAEVQTSAPDEYKTVMNDSLNGGMYIE